MKNDRFAFSKSTAKYGQIYVIYSVQQFSYYLEIRFLSHILGFKYLYFSIELMSLSVSYKFCYITSTNI